MQIHPFDLQARAGLAAHALTQLVDPEREGLMYFLADWRARPPRAVHGLWDCGDGSGRHVDALTLARSLLPAGSPQALPDTGEAQIEGWMLRLLGADGLSWLPAEPWAKPWGAELLLCEPQEGERLAEVSWAQRGTLLGLTTRFQAIGEERYREAGRKLIDGLRRIAIECADGLYFPEGYFRPGGWRCRQAGLAPGIEEVNSAVLVPAVRFYAAAGYAPALELAEGLARFALQRTPGYLPDGSLRAGVSCGLLDHFHTRSNFILGLLELGLVTDRREYIAWARQSYEYAKAWGTDFGWFPEGLGSRHGEICCTTDMIEIALQLGRHVDPAYFADAERFGRNHLLESQILSLERLRTGVERLPAGPGPAEDEARYSTTRGVIESQVGAFASRPALNDAFHPDAAALMQCCNAAGTRALYDLWRYAVEEEPASGAEPARFAVQLRFSVETPGLRVISYEPSTGRLDFQARQESIISVRLPDGTASAVVVEDGQAGGRNVEVIAGRVTFSIRVGQTVELHYPLQEKTADYQVGTPGRTLVCRGAWRGETLMQVEPLGPYYPLYGGAKDLPPALPALPQRPLIDSLALVPGG